MNTHETQMSVPVKNLGLINRFVRLFIGGAMFVVGWYAIVGLGHVFYGVVISLVSAYPLITAMLGWDPLFQVSGSRRYSAEGRM